MKCLVSICNKLPETGAPLPGLFLFEVDAEKSTVRPLPLGHPRLGTAHGICGLARFGDGLLAAMQGASQLAYLDRNLRMTEVWNVPRLKHGHSITIVGKKAYVASTGNDSIVEFDPATGGKVAWRANGSDSDTIHMNSVTWHDGHLCATAFGVKSGKLWNTATAGFLKDLATGRVLVGPIAHPHSLCRYAGQLYFCESSRMAVRRQSGETLMVGRGYTRGLAITDELVYVGISRRRTHSVSANVALDPPPGPAPFSGRCALMIYRHNRSRFQDSELLAEISLADYGNEVFDILPLQAA